MTKGKTGCGLDKCNSCIPIAVEMCEECRKKLLYYYTIKDKTGHIFSTFVMNTKVDLPLNMWCNFDICGDNGEETNLSGLLEEISKEEYEKLYKPVEPVENSYGDDY